jgi:hypothetical protein
MPANFLPAVGNESVGQRTAHGTWLPPGARVAAYVGPQSESTDAYSSSSLLVSTLAAGLARCRSGKGDVVAVLPGHTETVSTTTMLDSLVPGTQIIGVTQYGSGLMPTFTFSGTTTTSSWALNDANVTVRGIKFNFNGADSIDAPILISADSVILDNCLFNCGSDTALDCDVPVSILTGATNCRIQNCEFLITGTAVNTNLILVSGTGVNNFMILNNYLYGNCASSGLVNITGTATGFRIANNIFHNISGTAPNGVKATDTALTGSITDNGFLFSTDITVLTGAISLAGVSTSEIRMLRNFGCDEDSLGGVLTPTATGLE